MTGIKLFLIFVPILGMVLLLINFIFAPHRPYKEKKTPFECGYHSFLFQNRTEFTISYYLFGILFIDFDLEIVLVTPGAPSLYFNDLYGITSIILFVAILGVGFIYELGKGVLKIDSKQHKILIQSDINFINTDFILNKVILLNISLQIFNTLVMLQYLFPMFIVTYICSCIYFKTHGIVTEKLILNVLVILFIMSIICTYYGLSNLDIPIISMSGSEDISDNGEGPSHVRESSPSASAGGPNNENPDNDDQDDNNKRKRSSSEDTDNSESQPNKAFKLDDNIEQEAQEQGPRAYDSNNAIQPEAIQSIETGPEHEPSGVNNPTNDGNTITGTEAESEDLSPVDEDSCGCDHNAFGRQGDCRHSQTRALPQSDVEDFSCCVCRQPSPDLACSSETCSCVVHTQCTSGNTTNMCNDDNNNDCNNNCNNGTDSDQ